MPRVRSKVIDMLVERRLTSEDMDQRTKVLRERVDKLGKLLNAMKAKWNLVHKSPDEQITESDYDRKVFDS